MVVLSLGKKGSGKTAVLRKLAYRRLTVGRRHPPPLIFWHDPGCQVRGGPVLSSMADARELFRTRGIPPLTIYRGCDVEELAQLALAVKDVTLVVDELDRACQGKTWKSNSVRRIVHEGRHFRVDLFGTFRATRNVNEDLLSQADYVFLHRTSVTSEYDVATIRRRFGESYASAVTKLEPMQFVVWSDA